MGLLWVAGRLPSLNQIIAESAGADRGWSKYGQTKARWTEQVVLMARVKGIQPIRPSYWAYLFCEPNRKADPTNIVSGGVKILEDAFQAAGLIPNDGWNDILGFTGYWEKMAHRVGCLVYWGDAIPSKETMLVLLAEELGKMDKNGNSIGKNGNRPGTARHGGPDEDAAEATPGDA